MVTSLIKKTQFWPWECGLVPSVIIMHRYHKTGWPGPILVIFYDLLPHCNHSTTTWHSEYMALCPYSALLIKKTCNFRSPSFLVFLSLQTWEVAISEMGWLGPILDMKLIPVVVFFSCNSRANELLERQKLDQMIFQQPEHSICTKKYSYHS